MLYFIVNPASSSGKGIRIWEQTHALLDERKVEYKAFMLRKKGETKRIASKLSASGEEMTVILVGGDGTINEFLSGLDSFSHITFGVVQTGSGNDFARALELPDDPARMLDLILSGEKVRPLHIGRVLAGGVAHSFAVSSGIGLDAAVCDAADDSGAKSFLNSIGLGKLIYSFHGLKALLTNPVMKVTLETEKETLRFDKVFFIAAMNTKYEGGGYMFAPEATPEDEYLDLMIAEGIPRIKAVGMMLPARSGRHTGMKGIHIIRCRQARIHTDRCACLHTDGEVPGYFDEIEYSLSEDRLRTITGY